MPKISRLPLDKKIKQDLINEFWYTLGKLNKNQVELIFKELLSPVEVIMLAKRLEILKMLTKKFTYEDIGKSIKVTGPTIAKVSMVSQKSDSRFHSIINNLIMDENKRWKKTIDSRKPYWKGKKFYYTPR